MNNWTEEKWQICRRISTQLVGLNINISPRVIMEWDEATYKTCTDWLGNQYECTFYGVLKSDAGKNPPDFLKHHIVPDNLASDFEHFSTYLCFKDTIYRHHEGAYTEYSLDDRGNCVDVWIDGRCTGKLDLEGGGFNGGEVEKQILLKEGYSFTQVMEETNG